MCIIKSNDILLIVANDQLRGATSVTDQALVLQYINFADNEILPAVCAWVFPTLGIMPQDSKVCAHVISLAVCACVRAYNFEMFIPH